MKTISQTILVAAAIVLAAGHLNAQGATAAISGNVLDPSGAAIAGASITVRNAGTAFTRTVLSDDQGRYVVPELPIGDYEVQGSLAGFQTVVRRGILLTVGSRPVVDLAEALARLASPCESTGQGGSARQPSGARALRQYRAGEPPPARWRGRLVRLHC